MATHKIPAALITGAAAVAVVVVILWTSGILAGRETQVSDATTENTSAPLSSQSNAVPAGTLYPVTALPGQTKCERSQPGSQQPQMGTSEIEAAVAGGVVQIVTDIGVGSGFIADPEGIVVTDSRVVEGSWLIKVTLQNGKTLSGALLGINQKLGIAYIGVSDEEKLFQIPMGNSDNMCAGDNAFAFQYQPGPNPEGNAPIITTGRISSVGKGFLATDLLLSPKSIGGPLLGNSGMVVGVNSIGLGVSGSEAISARNFAVPINGIRKQIEDGLDRGQLTAGARPALLPTATPTVIPTLVPTPPLPTTTPVPQPMPTATPATVQLPSPTPQPEATRTPLPRVRATPTPVPSPTRVARPRIQPTSTPTPTLAPTRAPTPTRTPTPAPVVLDEYMNNKDGYSIAYPDGWSIEGRQRGRVSLVPRSGEAYIEVSSESILIDWSLGEFTDHYRQRKGRQASSWEMYSEVSAAGKYRGATNYVRIEFRRQINSSDCIESGVTDLYRSRYFPSVLKGFAVTMSICEDRLVEHGELREEILSSFTEFQTE